MSNVEEEDLKFCFEGDFNCKEKKELMCLFNSAFADAHAKLCKYFLDGAQPASKFLQQIRMLDPRNLIDVERNFDSTDGTPGFEAVSRNEWDLYVNSLGPAAVKYSRDDSFDSTSGRQRQKTCLNYTSWHHATVQPPLVPMMSKGLSLRTVRFWMRNADPSMKAPSRLSIS